MPSPIPVDGHLSPTENAALAIELEDRWRASEERAAANRLWRILMLAPDLEVGEALCRGEKVPVSRLDPAWARRFGLL